MNASDLNVNGAPDTPFVTRTRGDRDEAGDTNMTIDGPDITRQNHDHSEQPLFADQPRSITDESPENITEALSDINQYSEQSPHQQHNLGFDPLFPDDMPGWSFPPTMQESTVLQDQFAELGARLESEEINRQKLHAESQHPGVCAAVKNPAHQPVGSIFAESKSHSSGAHVPKTLQEKSSESAACPIRIKEKDVTTTNEPLASESQSKVVINAVRAPSFPLTPVASEVLLPALKASTTALSIPNPLMLGGEHPVIDRSSGQSAFGEEFEITELAPLDFSAPRGSTSLPGPLKGPRNGYPSSYETDAGEPMQGVATSAAEQLSGEQPRPSLQARMKKQGTAIFSPSRSSPKISLASPNPVTPAASVSKRKREPRPAEVHSEPENGDRLEEDREIDEAARRAHQMWQESLPKRTAAAVRNNEVPTSLQIPQNNQSGTGDERDKKARFKRLDNELFGTPDKAEAEAEALELQFLKDEEAWKEYAANYKLRAQRNMIDEVQEMEYQKRKTAFRLLRRQHEAARFPSGLLMSDDEKDKDEPTTRAEEDDEILASFAPGVGNAMLTDPNETAAQRLAREKADKREEAILKRKMTRQRAQRMKETFLEGLNDYQTPEQLKRSKQRMRTLKQQEKMVTKMAKAKGQDTPALLNLENGVNLLDDLMNGNTLADANETAAKSAPKLKVQSTGKRKEALQQFINGIPEDGKEEVAESGRQIGEAVGKLGGHWCRWDKDSGEGWKLKGINAILRHHQILAISLMSRRESDGNTARGGLLADAMGFGKTIEMLGTMVHQELLRSRKPGIAQGPKTTLIVAPVGLLGQWQREIKRWCKEGMFPLVQKHHGTTKFETSEMMQAADIVLTTYHEVCRSMPDFKKKPAELIETKEVALWWRGQWDNHRGPLHRAEFLRVVLDESQSMANHGSRTSAACRALHAERHWAISGTPILNGIDSFYSYLRFFKLSNAAPTYQLFLEMYCKAGSQISMERLLAFLRGYMIRRTHKDMILGRSICELPSNYVETKVIEFNPVERAVYETVRTRFLKRINILRTDGQLETKYSNILVMLLRLRQMTAHLFLCESTITGLFTLEDIDKIHRISCDTKKMRRNGQSTISMNVMKDMETEVHQLRAAVAAAATREHGPNTQVETGAGRLEDYDITPYMRSMYEQNEKEIGERSGCHRCNDFPEQAIAVKPCRHIYCLECFHSMAADAALNGHERTVCLACGEVYEGYDKVSKFRQRNQDGELMDSDYIDDPLVIQSEEEAEEPKKGKKKQKTTNTAKAKPKKATEKSVKQSKKQRDERLQALSSSWILSAGKILPSAKLAAIGEKVMEVFKEGEEEKIIIFTQMLGMIDIIGRYLQDLEGTNTGKYRYLEYSGRQTLGARSSALEQFDSNKEIRIMVASLRAGGVGLNLTAASRVILVDLWWNQAVEDQAFCRVFRIGQRRETYVTRLIIKDTIDEQLDAMQKRKQEGIDTAMGSKRRQAKLSVEELIRLFGGEAAQEADQEWEAQLTRDNAFFENMKDPKSGRAKGSGKKAASKPNIPIPDSIADHMEAALRDDLMNGGDGMGFDIGDMMDMEDVGAKGQGKGGDVGGGDESSQAEEDNEMFD